MTGRGQIRPVSDGRGGLGLNGGMAPFRFRIKLPPKPDFRSGPTRPSRVPRKPVPRAPGPRRRRVREDLRAIFLGPERSAFDLLRSPWRWTVLVVTVVTVHLATHTGNVLDPRVRLIAPPVLSALLALACFVPESRVRVTGASLTLLAVPGYAIATGGSGWALLWLFSCAGIGALRLYVRGPEEEDDGDAGESGVSEIVRRRIEEDGFRSPPGS